MHRRSRILVVEDDETLRATIADVMTDDGHEVRVAGDGQDALEVLSDWQPDVVILDVMMPRMDAFAFREAEASIRRDRATKVLVVSAATDVGSAAERLRADAWLAKPFALVTMVETVNRLLGRSAPPGVGRVAPNGNPEPSAS